MKRLSSLIFTGNAARKHSKLAGRDLTAFCSLSASVHCVLVVFADLYQFSFLSVISDLAAKAQLYFHMTCLKHSNPVE